MWIHYTRADGGDFARVCPDLVTAFAVRFLSDEDYGTVSLPAPAAGGRATTELQVSGTAITVLRNGVTKGRLPLPADAPDSGPIQVGFSSGTGGTAPFAATVYAVEVRAPL